jgi:hypothetical protein
MTITVTPDINDGTTFGLGANGAFATRVFSVETTANETMAEILLDSNIPQYGAVHPDTGGSATYLPIYALEFDVRAQNAENSIFLVTVGYARPDFQQKEAGETEADCTIQVGSSVSSQKTAQDKDGNRIVVSLTGFEDQTGEVDIQIPETVIVFERKESSNPLSKSIANSGKVNSLSLGGGDYAIRSLLCLGIEGITQDDGETWQVTYRFQYKPATWRTTVLYIDPETDRPADTINIPGNDGVEYVDVYPEIDFSGLNLPWSA